MNEKSYFEFRRSLAIAKKEFAHILRDKFTLGLALVMPIVVVFVFGVAIEFNQTNIPTAVIDEDHSQSSRQLVETFSSSKFFQVSYLLSSSEINSALESENAKAVILIPHEFEKNLLSGRGSDVQILINAADNQSAGSVLSYLGDLQFRLNKKLIGLNPINQPTLETRFLFNPELNSRWFTVPGLMVIIMTMIALLLTALTVAKEWEFGSMELLLSTPVKPLEIIIGKISPYAILCFVAIFITYFCARVLFGVPFRGNHITYLFGCFLFLVTYLAQGLMISVLTRKQMLAMQISMLTGLLPSQLLSGFIFPIENMPKFFDVITIILPARWFMQISRESFLQGASLWQMRNSFLALFALMSVFVIVAIKKFKRDLEP